MRGFKFTNLCGVVHKKGNLVFTPDGNSVISAVGNRVTVFDLINNTSTTLPFENRKDIKRIDLSPDGALLITIDEDGHAVIANFYRRIILSYFHFKQPIRAVKFSPSGEFLAVVFGSTIQIWRTPSLHKEFAPMVLFRNYHPHQDEITCLEWDPSSRFFVTGSKDFSVRITPMLAQYKALGIAHTFLGYRQPPIGCFFGQNDHLYVVSYNSVIDVRQWNKNTKKWQMIKKDIDTLPGKQGTKAMTTCFDQNKEVLVVGFIHGLFMVLQMPQCEVIHSLSLSDHSNITASAINPTGDWIALGSAINGTLLVWEWQSETYILKQQGHSLDMSSLSYSADGAIIATGADDGKVKLWNASSGYCFVTFSDHKGGVPCVKFSANSNNFVLFSASLDGTVRAYDLLRYRNFRVFTAGDVTGPAGTVQFTSLTTDPSGEIICAGTHDTFQIYVWTIQTGQLLDVLSGHEAPVSSLEFSPMHSKLASTSWDGSLRLWDVYEGGDAGNAKEVFQHRTDVLCLAFRPDGKEICTSCLDGSLSFWDVLAGVIIGTIEGRKDIMGGRLLDDPRSMKTSPGNKHFTTVCYSADGESLLAGGNSKYVCIYSVSQKLLLKKFQITHNLSLDGVLDFLNSKLLTEVGRLELLDLDEDDEYRTKFQVTNQNRLPGAKKGQSKRSTPPAIMTRDIEFSPTGRAWAAVTTEGLLIYSLDDSLIFDPFDLDLEVTPENVQKLLSTYQFLPAFVMSFRLNEEVLIRDVYRNVPPQEILPIVQKLPPIYLPRLMTFLGKEMDTSKQLERDMLWCVHLLSQNAGYFKDLKSSSPMWQGHMVLSKKEDTTTPSFGGSNMTLLSAFRFLQKNLVRQMNDLSKMTETNLYSLDYFVTVLGQKPDDSDVQMISTPNEKVEELEGEEASDESAFVSNWAPEENNDNGDGDDGGDDDNDKLSSALPSAPAPAILISKKAKKATKRHNKQTSSANKRAKSK